MKRILIMVMGCNDDFFNKQCEVVKETWAKPILEGKYPNIQFVIYKGTENTYPRHTYDKASHELRLRVEDDLDNTYKKTYYAFSLVKNNFEYDYIFRTNTSTFINIDLLNEFIQNKEDNDIVWTSDLYSLSEAYCPYPLYAYGRGNGLLFYKTTIDILLKEGVNWLYAEKCDDWIIGNILNSYWIKQGKNYLDYIKSFRHGWFKCIGTKADNRNSICPYYNDNTDFNFLKEFMTLQIKRYREREIENNNYYELWDIFSNNKDTDLQDSVAKQIEYSENPNVFIGSILGYIPYDTWVTCDKSKLYELETTHKASDDAEHYKNRKTLF